MYSKHASLAGFPETDPELGKFVGGAAGERWLWWGGAALVGAVVAWYFGWGWGLAVAVIGGFVGLPYTSLAIYEQGVRQGRKTIRWDEAEHVTCDFEVQTELGSGRPIGRRAFLWIRGRRCTIRDFRTSFRLHNIALGYVAPALAKRRLREAEEGSRFTVGSVSVEQGDLVYRGTHATLAAGGAFRVAGGKLIVWSADSLGRGDRCWFTISASTQDAHVLAEMLRIAGWSAV